MKSITLNNPQFMMLPTGNEIEAIDISTIVRIEAISNYSKLYFCGGRTLVVAKVLRWFEEILNQYNAQNDIVHSAAFIRIHRTHLVNKKYIHKYSMGKVKMLNGDSIEVSRRKKAWFRQCWLLAA